MNTTVKKMVDGKGNDQEDTVADETFMTVYLDGEELVTLSCSPTDVQLLCVGFLYSSGFIRSLDDIKEVSIVESNLTTYITLKNRSFGAKYHSGRLYTSGCGKSMLFYNLLDFVHAKTKKNSLRIQADSILRVMKSFEEHSVEFRNTGGTHSAAFSDGCKILAFKEDIGRHNAIDKIIGQALYDNLPMNDLIILTSGRISSDVLYKMHKTGTSLIISRGAPTSLAIRLAKKSDITLVGFARGKRMNIYTAPERIETGVVR